MASVLLTLFAGVLVLLCFSLYLIHTYWKRNGIPTAKGYYPFIGHVFPVLAMETSFADMIRQIYDDHKNHSMVGIYKGIKPALIVREPKLIETVMQSNFSSFHDNGFKIEPDVDPLFAKNPFFTNGNEWMTARKRLTYAFSAAKLKNLFVAINGVCEKFQNYLNVRLKSNNKYEVELKYLFSKFTGEVVANAGLSIEGLCFEEIDHPGAFDQIGQLVFQPSLFETIRTQLLLLFPDLNRLVKLSFTPKVVDRLFRRIVAKNLDLRQKDSTPRNDFLQLMMDLEKEGEKMNADDLAAEVFSFYADGFETSSITLSFIGYQLAAHQNVQERLRDEVKSIIEKHEGVLTYDALKEMKYMDQVINESQRLYPAIPVMSRSCTEEFLLEGSDGLKCRVKPGTEILLPAYATQRDSKYWPESEVFDPERFNDEEKQNIHKMTYLPFGGGPRMCVGMRMAMLQMKACLATLLRNYKLELSPKMQLPLKVKSIFFLISSNDGIWVHISKL